MTKKTDLFHLKNLNISNRNSGFEKNYEILSSDDSGYDTYVSRYEPNKNPEVTYRLNKDGFRSENFKKLEAGNLNVLISGCSFTYAQGVLQENSWPELLSKTISLSSSKPVKMYNLGIMGSSIYLIVKNLMAFIRKYGAPDQIYLLLPPHSRKLIYDDSTDNFKNLVMNKDEYKKLAYKKADPSTKRFYDSYCEEDSLLLAISLMGIFEDFCEAKKIDLIWTSYGAIPKIDFFYTSGFKFYKKYAAPNFEFYTNKKAFLHLLHLMPENEFGVPHWEMGADRDHPGAAWHEGIAKMFFDFKSENL
jgi:hypothetical protein